MPVLVILIIFSLVFYLYLKVKQVRTRRPFEKKWISGKSSISLGVFVLTFGINQVFLFPEETVTYVIAAIFFIVGLLSIIGGYKMYKYYLPLAVKEAEQLHK